MTVDFGNQVTCFAEAGGQHVSEMAKAVELLGLRACLVQSTMDCGEGLPASWAVRTTDDCIQVVLYLHFLYNADNCVIVYSLTGVSKCMFIFDHSKST